MAPYIGPSSGKEYSFDVTKRTHSYSIQTLNQQDVDRNFCLSTANLFKWMQAARMELPWVQSGYRAYCQVEPPSTRRFLVGSQMIKLAKPGMLANAVDNTVTIKLEIGDVGRTSVEFRYAMLFGRHQVATGTTIMISAVGEPGGLKPGPVPDDVRTLASPSRSDDGKFMREALGQLPRTASADAYSHSVVVRYSDEDINQHANHSACARFFEDAKEAAAQDESVPPALREAARQPLFSIAVSYMAETRALDELEVKVALCSHGELGLWINRLHPKPGAVARGFIIIGDSAVGDSDAGRQPAPHSAL